MYTTLFAVLLICAGLWFTIFGLRLLFQKGYVEKLREGIWKPRVKLFSSERRGYNYDKYSTGIKNTILGLIFLVAGIYSILKILHLI